MIVITSYTTAVLMCVVTMLCWGSWANTQKLASREWEFPLFYWDYSLGILLFALLLAFTMGSMGDSGRPFMADLAQASHDALLSALIGLLLVFVLPATPSTATVLIDTCLGLLFRN